MSWIDDFISQRNRKVDPRVQEYLMGKYPSIKPSNYRQKPVQYENAPLSADYWNTSEGEYKNYKDKNQALEQQYPDNDMKPLESEKDDVKPLQSIPKATEQIQQPQQQVQPEQKKMDFSPIAEMVGSIADANSGKVGRTQQAFEHNANIRQQQEERTTQKDVNSPISRLAQDVMRGVIPDYAWENVSYYDIAKIYPIIGQYIKKQGDKKQSPFAKTKESLIKPNTMANIVNKINSDPSFKNALSAYNASTKIEQFLNSSNQSIDTTIGVLFARAAGDVGMLSDQDIARWGGDPALLSKAKQMFEKTTEGKLTPENRKILKEAAQVMKDASNKIRIARLNAIAKAQGNIYKGIFTPEEIKNNIFTQYEIEEEEQQNPLNELSDEEMLNAF